MAGSLWKFRYRVRRTWVPYFVALVGLAVTATAAAYVARVTRDKDRARYENATRHTSDAIRHGIDTYVAMLHGTAALFAAHPDVRRADFDTFVRRMRKPEPHEGVQGIGFAARVVPSARVTFIRRMQQEGLRRFIPGSGESPFDIWTVGADTEKADSYPITYLEKMDLRNRAAIGYDMFSEPVRREAMERARDLGAAAASGKVLLVQEIYDYKQAGFLIYVPMYQRGGIPGTVEERRELIRGFVYSPFRAEDFLAYVSEPETASGLELSVYDGDGISAERLLYSSPRRMESSSQPVFSSVGSLDIGGRRWTLAFATDHRFEVQAGRELVGLVLLGGALITLLLFVATRSQAEARAAAEDAASELRASGAALRMSEARARRVFESGLIGIVYWENESGRIVEANEAFLNILGYAGEGIKEGKLNWHDLSPPEYLQQDAEAAGGLAADGAHPPYEKELYREGGTKVPVIVGNARLEAAEGLNVGFVVDLTERRRAQLAERESEQRLRLTADAVPAVLSYIDSAQRYRLTNEAFRDWFGFSPEQAYGRHMKEVLGAANYLRLAGHIQAALSGRNVDFEARLDMPEGTARDVHGVYIPDIGPDDHVRGAVAFISDITDRKQAEQDRARLLVREREARSEAETLNRIGRSLSAELDIDRLVQGLTDAATALTGAGFGAFIQLTSEGHVDPSIQAVTGDGVLGLSPEWWIGLAPSPESLAIATVRVDDLAGDTRRSPSGGPCVRSYLSVPVRSRGGEVFGALVVGHSDPKRFTERHERILNGIAAQAAVALDNARLYRSNEEAREEAVTANRMKDEFLAIVSHELRTPLNAILGWAHLLRKGRLGPDQAARGIETIERNARAQAQLIGDLLDVSRITSGKLNLDMQEVNLANVVDAAVETLMPDAAAKGVRIEKDLRPAGLLLGDPGRLQQVVWNLLSNAIKFTPAGGLVRISLAQSGGQAELRVADTGAGIAPTLLPHIFDRFRQGEATAVRKHGGLGLGLAIVRHLVALHHGTVHAASAGEGSGAEFTVRMPLIRANRPAGPAPAHQEHAPYPQLLTGVRVMIVDDDPDSRDLMSVALGHAGARVLPADSAQSALAGFGQFSPDVLISDIGMPGEDGYGLLRKLRSNGVLVPALALTAFAREEDRRRAFSAGFQEHVPKPVDTERVIRIVARLSGRAGPLSAER
jgi:PAS domain S-box-containing protein